MRIKNATGNVNLNMDFILQFEHVCLILFKKKTFIVKIN